MRFLSFAEHDAIFSLETAFRVLAQSIEALGVGLLVVGLVAACVRFLYLVLQKRKPLEAYEGFRKELARALMLALEILIAADIIFTIAVEPNLQSLGILAAIVFIRTFLSWSLEVEINGHWPWKKPDHSKEED